MPLWKKRKEVLVENAQTNSGSDHSGSPKTSPSKNKSKHRDYPTAPALPSYNTTADPPVYETPTYKPTTPPDSNMANTANGGANTNTQETDPNKKPPTRTPKYQFHCQLAQGSPTGIISGFTNVKELYASIAECFEFDPKEILFCTLDTHKPDMSKLLGGQIALDNLIFAHTRGQAKELEVCKKEDALGLTITDNGNGYAFIKRIKEDSIMANIVRNHTTDPTQPPEKMVTVGDHIEKINGKSVVNARHYEVAKMLKDIPKGHTFTIRLIEPVKSEWSMVSSYRGNKKKTSSLGTGKATIRLKASGGGTEGVMDDNEELAVKAIDGLLESFLGVNDSDLARSIYENGESKANPSEFAVVIDELYFEFEFTDDFIYDVWGVIGDAKAGRLKPTNGAASNQVEFSEHF